MEGLTKTGRCLDQCLLSGREGGSLNPPGCRPPQLTLQHDDGEVLRGLGLAGGKALVGPGVALLGRGDEQSLVAEPADGDGLVGQHQLSVAVPADGEFRGAQQGTGEDDRAADPGLQLLWCQGHVKGVWARPAGE